jgi:hypothetical protein
MDAWQISPLFLQGAFHLEKPVRMMRGSKVVKKMPGSNTRQFLLLKLLYVNPEA